MKTYASDQKVRDTIDAYIFLFPSFAGLALFLVYPIASSILLGFTDWNGFSEMTLIGFDNFKELVSHDTFLISLRNTGQFVLGVVPGQIILALIVAVLLNSKIHGIKIYRMIFFMPYISSLASIAILWTVLLHPTIGPVNQTLRGIGISQPPAWLADQLWAMPSIVGMSVWKSFGYFSVIFLAALQGIPQQLYEAATIDRANSWHKFWRITLPLLTPSIFYSLIIATISSFKVFDQVYIMTEGGPGRATTTIVQYIYQQSFQYYRMGYASAAAFVLFLIILSITVIQRSTEGKWVHY